MHKISTKQIEAIPFDTYLLIVWQGCQRLYVIDYDGYLIVHSRLSKEIVDNGAHMVLHNLT